MSLIPPDAADASAGTSQPPPSGSTLRISTVRFSALHESGPKTACSRKHEPVNPDGVYSVPAAAPKITANSRGMPDPLAGRIGPQPGTAATGQFRDARVLPDS